MKDITDVDYMHGKRLCKYFEIKSLEYVYVLCKYFEIKNLEYSVYV